MLIETFGSVIIPASVVRGAQPPLKSLVVFLQTRNDVGDATFVMGSLNSVGLDGVQGTWRLRGSTCNVGVVSTLGSRAEIVKG